MHNKTLISDYIGPFFHQYCTEEKGASRHTLLSYRDTFKLMIQYLSRELSKKPEQLTIEMMSRKRILAFLDYLEQGRNCSVRTRNQRLAAIKSFFAYISFQSPAHLGVCQNVKSINYKKTSKRRIPYLTVEDMNAFLKSIPTKTNANRRDYLILHLMYVTGMRVSELLSLSKSSFIFDKPCRVRVTGKGRKSREVVLWLETAKQAKEFIEQSLLPEDEPIFRSHLGKPLTRYGVRHILQKHYLASGVGKRTSSPDTIHPHIIRHTTGVHLLESNVDVNSIREWLGHVSLDTTLIYSETTIKKKLEALKKCQPFQSEAIKIKPKWKNKKVMDVLLNI